MPSWKGNTSNPVPNPIQESSNLSERKKTDYEASNVEKDGENRSVQTRRDTDNVKDISIKLMDIDTIIFNHMVDMQLSVVDDGKTVKVPVYYASPERWKSVQKDGVFRDYNGKIILPAIVFHREMSERDQALATFNRYLRYPVMKKYSTKNKYTTFSNLVGTNAPINEVYDVVYPDHMIFTYKFIIWTEYVEQMNKLVEKINFETEDYWGAPRGIRLRTSVDSYSHTVELQADVDRVVKTDFNLMVHGYLLPDTFNVEFARRPTTRKILTPKRIVISAETVTSDFNPYTAVDDRDKWRSQKYPNLAKTDEPQPPPTVWSEEVEGTSTRESIVSTFNSIYQTSVKSSTRASNALSLVAVPAGPGAAGHDGEVASDDEYFYVYAGGRWRRTAISQFT
jgi:hypothetical protein